MLAGSRSTAPVERRGAWLTALVRGGSSFAVVVLALAAAACGNGPAAPDAPIDTPPDMTMGCGADMTFTGEIVDWDSNPSSGPGCGVSGATVTVRGQPGRTDSSNFNGRFEVCAARQAQTPVDVSYSASASTCAAVAGAYPVRAVLIAAQAVIEASSQSFSARAMTQGRQDQMFTQVGQAYSAAKAQLIVHVVGAERQVVISVPHAPAQRYNGATWGAGDTGPYVFFPNVDAGAVQLTVTGGAVGTGTLMLEAGAYTQVTVIAN